MWDAGCGGWVRIVDVTSKGEERKTGGRKSIMALPGVENPNYTRMTQKLACDQICQPFS
jgi:hypothetical protein